jgi:hypothetical protein
VHRVKPALMILGCPGHGFGSALVISRRARLLATAAHVVEIEREAGDLFAVRADSGASYRVRRSWYHPDWDRSQREGTIAFVRGESSGPLFKPAPDVAVVELEPGGSDLPVQFDLMRPNLAGDLLHRPVGLLGFSGEDTSRVAAFGLTHSSGTVTRLVSFRPTWGDQPAWTMLDLSARSASGDSGGPIFSLDGRVLGLCAWCQPATSSYRVNARTPACGIRVDCLWELIEQEPELMQALKEDGPTIQPCHGSGQPGFREGRH